MAGLVREAASRALDDAEMTWGDIDAVVIGKAPDFFEGVMMPELFLADALGATGKPLFRVHTAGSRRRLDRASSPSQLVQAGIHERVLTVAFEKQCESEAMWALSMPIPFQPPLHAGAGGYFAPHIRSLHGAGRRRPTTSGSSWRSRTGRTRCKNPYAHLHEHDISFDSIKDSMMLWDPIRYAETCPSSDGACAMVLASEAVADARDRAGRLGEGHRHALRADHVGRTATPCCRAAARSAPPTSTRRPASPTRASEVDCVEMYVPFSWFEPMWLENLHFAPSGRGLEVRRGRRHPARRRPAR